MTFKTKGILLGILCLLTGSVWYYFQGYKENALINYSSIILVYIGWIILLFSLFGQKLLKGKKVKFKEHKILWLKDNLTKAAIYLTFGICLVATMEFTDRFSSERINSILQTRPTNTTIATVIRIEERHSRTGSKLWAVIEYQTEAKTVEQSVFDYKKMYSIGQKYIVRYSIEYPEMFQLLRQTE